MVDVNEVVLCPHCKKKFIFVMKKRGEKSG